MLMSYEPSELELLAIKTVEEEFSLNKQFHSTFHERQRRYYNLVLNKVDEDLVVEEGRSDIKTGVPHMLHEIPHSVLKDALTSGVNVCKIKSPKSNGDLLYEAEIDDYLHHLFTDENIDIKSVVDDAIWDLVATGSAVPCARWDVRHKRIFKEIEPFIDDNGKLQQGKREFDVVEGSYPTFDLRAPWDVFPSAGATSIKQCHEVIIRDEPFPHQLREWERQGMVQNIDDLLELVKANKAGVTVKENREDGDSGRAADTGKIEILIYWGLFPLYKYKEYIGDDGIDRSKDEVQCLIIKAKDYPIILHIGRNPFDCQEIPVFIGKYFRIPGQIWGEGIFSIGEKMLVHQERWFNLMQDCANAEIHRDIVIPDNVDEGEAAGSGVEKRYHVTEEAFIEGAYPKYLDRGPSILPEVYGQRDYLDRMIQEVTGVVDFVRGVQIGPEKTATEVMETSEKINARFKQRALTVESTLLSPIFNWLINMVIQFGDDDEIKEYTGLEVNPFDQFDAMMPNKKYRVKLDGAIRAAENMANRQTIQLLLTLAANIQEPMPDENGMMFKMNLQMLLYDLGKMSPLTDPNRYKLPIDSKVPLLQEMAG